VKQEKVKWGVPWGSVDRAKKVIPGMQQGEWSEIAAMRRGILTGQGCCEETGITEGVRVIEEMLADTEIAAVYNPRPNHLNCHGQASGGGGETRSVGEKP